jgi:acylphosphatase
MKISKTLRIRGKVHGVYFRESMRQEAMRLGVTGWVRNRKDGSVEALVQGEADLVAELVSWAHRGPTNAKVESVDEVAVNNETALSDFIRKETE